MKEEFSTLLQAHGRSEMPKVLLAAAECVPLSKTGGLADVVGTLPKALARAGVEARVITPYHRCIKDTKICGQGRAPVRISPLAGVAQRLCRH